MARFIIDVNLPYFFFLWRGSDFLHVKDIDDTWSDAQVWDFARREDLIIVTKDADFSARAILEPPPPRVIHIRRGNMKMRPFHTRITQLWPDICELSGQYRLVNVFEDRLEGID